MSQPISRLFVQPSTSIQSPGITSVEKVISNDQLLSKIFSYVDATGIGPASLVNRRWHTTSSTSSTPLKGRTSISSVTHSRNITPSAMNADPFTYLQNQELFEAHLNSTLDSVCQWKERDGDKGLATDLALLSISIELCHYEIPYKAALQIQGFSEDADLPLEIRFPLQQMLLSHAPNEKKEDLIKRDVHFISRNDMSLYYTRGNTYEKRQAIVASEIIEGNDFGEHGLRMAIHQRPNRQRTAALITSHVNEFLSGRRNFIFKVKNRESNEESINQGRRAVMLYILDGLKEERRSFYARNPTYLEKEQLERMFDKYVSSEYVFASDESEKRYLFEVAAQHLDDMSEAIAQVDFGEDFEKLASKFFRHYSSAYRSLPTFSLSVAAIIHPFMVLKGSDREAIFIEDGEVPEVLLELRKSLGDHQPSIFENFQQLIQAFDDVQVKAQLSALVSQLDRAVVQEEYYTEFESAKFQREKKVDPLYQPRAIFKAVKNLKSFMRQITEVSKEVKQEINKQWSFLNRLEEQAAHLVLEQVSEDNNLAKEGLEMVVEVAHLNGILKKGESVESFLHDLSDRSLIGYQNVRQLLYNSEIAFQWMHNAGKNVEGMHQTFISNLNSGLVGTLSQLVSFNAPTTLKGIGGQALKQGTFYGLLDIEPEIITPGKIAVLKTMPHDLAALQRAAAIIVEEGGPLSHAAHIARELDVPMITGAKGATTYLRPFNNEGVSLTVDDNGNRIEKFSQPFPSSSSAPTNAKKNEISKSPAGGKGKHLIQLRDKLESLPKIPGIELNIPSFLMLTQEDITAFYATSFDGITLKSAIEQAKGSPQKIWGLIEQCPLPFSLEKYSEALKMNPQSPIIARSSASVEDGASSFAGLFESIPNIITVKELELGIKKVLFSAFSQKIIQYADQRKIDGYSPFEMAVILQQYVAHAEISGVALSRDPVKSSPTVQLQLVKGVGGGVDGQSYPDTIAIDTQENSILYAYPGDRQKSLLLAPQQLKKIGLLVRTLEEQFHFPIDVEFAITKGENDQLILSLVQVRPITGR